MSMKESFPLLREQLQSLKEHYAAQVSFVEKVSEVDELWKLEQGLANQQFSFNIRAQLAKKRDEIKAHIKSKSKDSDGKDQVLAYMTQLLTVQVTDEASFELAKIIRQYLQAVGAEKKGTTWRLTAKYALGDALFTEIGSEMDAKLKLLPVLEQEIETYQSKKKGQQVAATQQIDSIKDTAEAYRLIEALNVAWEAEEALLEKGILEIQEKMHSIIGKKSQEIQQLELAIACLEKQLDPTSEPMGKSEIKQKKKDLKMLLARHSAAQNPLLVAENEKSQTKLLSEAKEKFQKGKEKYTKDFEALFKIPLKSCESQLTEAKKEIAEAKSLDDLKPIKEKIKTIEAALTTLKTKAGTNASVLASAETLALTLATVKNERSKKQRGFFVESLKDRLLSYLNERAITYKIRDAFSRIFASLFGWLGWVTAKEKRKTYVNTELFGTLNAFKAVNDDEVDKVAAAKTQVSDTIKTGLTLFSPRAQSGPAYEKSLKYLLSNAEAEFKEINEDQPATHRPSLSA